MLTNHNHEELNTLAICYSFNVRQHGNDFILSTINGIDGGIRLFGFERLELQMVWSSDLGVVAKIL